MKILLTGEGGQGVQVAGEILALAAFFENKKVSLIPNFGVEQRGGVSLVFLEIGENGYPKFDQADILAIFCDRAIERIKKHIGKDTKIILGPAVISKKIPGVSNLFRVEEGNLPAKVWNILVLKEIIRLTKIVKIETLKKALEEKFKEKFKENPEIKRMNLKALE
jgi:2-oxoglutarate ferredoxin oxidoreductase subunit gamma